MTEAIAQKPQTATSAKPLTIIISCAMPVIAAVYLGVAEGVRDRVIARAAGTDKALDPTTQRLVGLLDYKLRVARWSLLGAIAEIGDNPEPSMNNVVVAMQAKRAIAEEAISACDTALQIAGGSSYFRKADIEQNMGGAIMAVEVLHGELHADAPCWWRAS